MREGVRSKTKLYVICDMFRLLRSWVSDHEQLNDDLRNRSKVWTIQS